MDANRSYDKKNPAWRVQLGAENLHGLIYISLVSNFLKITYFQYFFFFINPFTIKRVIYRPHIQKEKHCVDNQSPTSVHEKKTERAIHCLFCFSANFS